MKWELGTLPGSRLPPYCGSDRPLDTSQGNLGPAERGLTPASPENWKLGDAEGSGSPQGRPGLFFPLNTQPSLALRKHSILTECLSEGGIIEWDLGPHLCREL